MMEEEKIIHRIKGFLWHSTSVELDDIEAEPENQRILNDLHDVLQEDHQELYLALKQCDVGVCLRGLLGVAGSAAHKVGQKVRDPDDEEGLGEGPVVALIALIHQEGEEHSFDKASYEDWASWPSITYREVVHELAKSLPHDDMTKSSERKSNMLMN